MKILFSVLSPIIIYVSMLPMASCVSNTQHQQSTNIETDTTWKSLTLREKIGQVMCLNYSNAQIKSFGDETGKKLLEAYPVGSFFMANWNLSPFAADDSLEQFYRQTVTNFSNASKYPLLFVEDFESGVGTAIPGYTQLTNEMGLGATQSPELAYKFGEIIASEARSIGVNWLLHPIADLNLNAFNHLTNVRGLTDNVNLSIKLLPQQVKGIQNQWVAATAKHFPGDGTDFINQHFNTSAMQLSYEEWKLQHGKAFKTLIDSGVMTIMAGHISFPGYEKNKLDENYLPATLSKELMTDLLKNELGFKGVIVSDALNMAGITGYYKNQLETEIECFKAGADVLLWPVLEFMDTLEARIERNEIPIERLDDAVSRVWNLKKKLGLFDAEYQTIKPIDASVLLEHKKWSAEISQNSITLLSNKHQILPIDTLSSKNILIVVVSETNSVEKFQDFKGELELKGFNVDIRQDLSMFTHGSELAEIQNKYNKIIFAFYSNPGNPWGTLALNGDQALSMWSANALPFEKVISIGFGDPYKNLIYMPRTWCRINSYGTDTYSQKAMVKLLIGEKEFTGISPVTYHGAKY